MSLMSLPGVSLLQSMRVSAPIKTRTFTRRPKQTARCSASLAWKTRAHPSTPISARNVRVLSNMYDDVSVERNASYTAEFLKTRLGVFISILLGYSCYYLTRNSLTFTAPAMVATRTLGLDITSIGVITSIFPLCYGCSKFVSGVVGDMLSPAIMLGGGLIATGFVNIAFGFSSTLPLFCLLWAMNGILQGFGAPSCAKILT